MNEKIEKLKTAWDQLAKGDLDGLASGYAEDMRFILPGQTDVLCGRDAFRTALDNLAAALPPGFDIADLRYFSGEDEVVNIVEWKCNKIPDGTQSAILWKFDAGGQIKEERWFIDTEQWRAAF